jgi:hypothetical protein
MTMADLRKRTFVLVVVSCVAACGGDAEQGSADAAVADAAMRDGPGTPDAAVGVCDDFERASLGGNWLLWASSNCSIVDNSDLAQTEPSTWCYAAYATTFAADQFSEAVISTDKPVEILTQVFVRQQPLGTPSGNGARYGFHYNADPGEAQWEIKYDGVASAETRRWTNATAAAPMPGDTIRLEARGSDPVMLVGFHDGVEVVVAIDAEPQRIAATGHTGVVERPSGGSPPPPNSAVFESWCGGDL